MSVEARPSGSAPTEIFLWDVDCATDETFLYACVSKPSELGIFLPTCDPYDLGTALALRFWAPNGEVATLQGVVQWVNPVRLFSLRSNPGMGVRLLEVGRAERELLCGLVRTIAYVRDHSN